MARKPCEYVVGASRDAGGLGFRHCNKMTMHRAKDSFWPWKRTPICLHHLQFSTLPPKEWI